MHYIGGKHRQGKIIAKHIKVVLFEGQWYIEPFCGAMGVAYRVDHEDMFLCDVSQALITMWQAFQDPDLELPDVITEETHAKLRKIRDPEDWMTAYVGFGMSFGARYFTKYARSVRGETGDNTAHSGRLKRSTNLKRKSNIMKAIIECFSYENLPKLPPNSVIYCDPPYEGTTKVHDSSGFNHDEFWDWCRGKVKEGHRVLVTEFNFPPDFVIVHNFGDTVARLGVKGNNPLDGKDSGIREVLVVHETQSHLWGLWDYEDKVNGTGETR